MNRGAGQTIIEDRYKRLASERRLLQLSATAAAFCTLLQAAVLNGIYVLQGEMPAYTSMTACGLGLLGFALYKIGGAGGQAHREKLWLLWAAGFVNAAAIALACFNFYREHMDSSLPDIPSSASYSDIVKRFSRYQHSPGEDRSVEALGSFLYGCLDALSEVLRFATILAAVMYIRDKTMNRSMKKAN